MGGGGITGELKKKKNERDLLSKFKELLFIEAQGPKPGAESLSEAASEIGIFLAQLLVSAEKNTFVSSREELCFMLP